MQTTLSLRAKSANADAAAPRANGISGRWTTQEVAWMGVLPDAEIAERIGCGTRAVADERRRRGIAAMRGGAPPPLRQALDGNRLRRHRYKLQLTQTELGARLGCNHSRVSQLENGGAPRVTTDTIGRLADALECQPADLRRADDLPE